MDRDDTTLKVAEQVDDNVKCDKLPIGCYGKRSGDNEKDLLRFK